MKGIFYGVGVGPGDPELVTLKAINIIKKADIIIAPKTDKNDKSIALNIVRKYINDSTDIILQTFPMINDLEKRKQAWEKNKNDILDFLKNAKIVVFLTLGDPMIYSTYIYIYKLLNKYKYPIETIPGIPSFCDIASKTGVTLAEGDEILRIIPATVEESKLDEAINSKDNLVLIKVYKNSELIIDKLKKAKNIYQVVMIDDSGLPSQKIYNNLKEINNKKKETYLSTLIVKKFKQQTEDSSK